MSEETKTTESTEVKENWFKKNKIACIIIAIVLVAAIVAAVLMFTMNKGQSPEEVVKTYVAAMQEGNVDKIMDMTDIKGAFAWYECGRDASKFEEKYKSISDSEINSYKDTFKSGLDSAMGMLKSFGGVEMTINNIEKPEELAKGLYKVKANTKMKVSVFGVEQEQDQDLVLAVYNGKFIGEASE